MSEKKAWETPSAEVLGTMREMTLDNAKGPGSFDGDPFQDCPPPKVGTSDCDGGIGALS